MRSDADSRQWMTLEQLAIVPESWSKLNLNFQALFEEIENSIGSFYIQSLIDNFN